MPTQISGTTGVSQVQDGVIVNADVSNTANIAGTKILADSITNAQLANQAVTNAKLAFDGGQLTLRNRVINGGFNIWQRNTTFTGINNNTFTADRWTTTSSNAVANKNVSRQTLNSTDLPATEAGLIYYLRGTYTSSTGIAQFAISTPLELNVTGNASPFVVGKTYTLSYYARCSINDSIGYGLQFRDASGSATNAAIVVAATSQAITTNWVRYSHTFTMTPPNVSNTSFCIIFTNNTIPANANIDITGVQLEEGSVATPFEQRPFGTELALCQRYCYAFTRHSIGSSVNGRYLYCASMPYPVTMRTVPTLLAGATFNPSSGNAGTPNLILGTLGSVTTQYAAAFENISNNWVLSNPSHNVTGILDAEL